MTMRTALSSFELRSSPAGQPDGLDEDGWIPAAVPGGVHESLMAAGRLDDPYRDENESRAAWVEDRVWWYRTTFTAPPPGEPGDRCRLVFHGLDTVCRVFLNGEEVLGHTNMFCPGEVDVTGRLSGHNTIHVRFEPPLRGLMPAPGEASEVAGVREVAAAGMTGEQGPAPTEAERAAAVERVGFQMARTRRRKATYSWGWDFAPRLPSIGIWQPVELVVEQGAALRGHRLRTLSVGPIDGEGRADARLLVEVEAEALTATGGLLAEVELSGPDGSVAVGPVQLPFPDDGRSLSAQTIVELPAAETWWTHDMGGQPLYTATITLLDGAGCRLDRRRQRIGIRTIDLDRSPDPAAEGNYFRFVLNGVPVFARGANWVPASMLPGAVDEARLEALIDRAADGRMNMLRIWGGGYYEHDRFYELCDERGILVWQDFMFACFDYPSEDPRLGAEVEREAVFQVRRLRNHACLAVWCGNNEVQAIHGIAQHNIDPGNWGHSFFHELLPRVVEAHDPGADYWPGSPWSELGASEVNGVRDGDRHAWEVWHGLNLGAGGRTTFASRGEAVHFSRYAHDTGRFISEFGIHAAPELATLERWTHPGSLALHSPAFDHRNKDTPKNKGDALMDYETGLPTDLAEYVELSMVCQAEGLKFGIEHYRRRQPSTSGTLIWQFNDPWPGITWSVVDYDGVPKASYYAARRAYAPVLASFAASPAGDLELWLTNSGREWVRGDLRVEVVTYDGRTVLDSTLEAAAGPGQSRCVWQASAEQVRPGPDRVAWVSSPGSADSPDRAGGIGEANRLFFGRVKEQEFGPHHVEISAVRDQRRSGGRSVELDVTAHGYNYFTRVEAPFPGVALSTNYFDLRDGQTVTVTVTGLPDAVDPSRLRAVAYRGPGPRA